MENALKCKHNGGTTPYGYYIDQKEHVLAVHTERAAVVQEIFNKYDNGVQIVDIMRSLNDRGIRCGYGHPFTKGRIGAILRNRRYIGEYKYDDIIVPGGIPAIIEKEQFDRVNRKLRRNKLAKSSAKAPDEYLLTTKLFCGKCGRMMIGECGSAHYSRRTYHYYKCGGAKRNQCWYSKGIRKNWIEKLAFIVTQEVVLNDTKINLIADTFLAMQNKEDPAIPAMKHQLSDCEKRISNILGAIESGVVTPSTRDRLEKLEKQRDMLSHSLLKLELEAHTYSKFELVSWMNHYRTCDADNNEYQRAIINAFLNAIYVFEDRYVFIYNFEKDTKTVSLDEVTEAFKDYLDISIRKIAKVEFVYLKSAFGFVITKDRLRRIHMSYINPAKPENPSVAE